MPVNVRCTGHRAGIEPLVSTPQEMASYVSAETAKWAKVIKEANVTLD